MRSGRRLAGRAIIGALSIQPGVRANPADVGVAATDRPARGPDVLAVSAQGRLTPTRSRD